jgi:hypothetical protein
MRLTLISSLVILVILVSGCAGMRFDGPDTMSFSTMTGNAPFHERFQQTSPTTFYLEELGNGFSDHETMERFFVQKATDLCGGEVKFMKQLRGRRFPDARLSDNILESCVYGKFCNRSHANFPLVFGTVECASPRAPGVQAQSAVAPQ